MQHACCGRAPQLPFKWSEADAQLLPMATDITNWLSDAQEMHKQHPDTFWAPSAKCLDAIRPDMHVKICDNEQRFWCTVKSTSGAHVVGVVADQTGHEDRGYGFGQNVTFEKRFVYAFADMEPADAHTNWSSEVQEMLKKNSNWIDQYEFEAYMWSRATDVAARADQTDDDGHATLQNGKGGSKQAQNKATLVTKHTGDSGSTATHKRKKASSTGCDVGKKRR